MDEMVEQAYQAAYIRWNPSGASNNQKEAQLNPEKALNRAVTIMSGLKVQIDVFILTDRN